MCGIFFLLNKKGKNISKNILEKSFESIRTRGTEEFNCLYVNKDKIFSSDFSLNSRMFFASSRFATNGILKTNKMPMISDQNNIIVFNGDIYNFDLIRKNNFYNYNFISDGDTEVLLKTYEKFGNNFINYVNGDYACVIFNNKKNVINAYVDFYSSKPLFYFNDHEFLIISSDIRSIENIIGKQELNIEFINHYLKTNHWIFSKEDYSINAFKNIRQITGQFFLEYKISDDELIFKKNDYINIDFDPSDFKDIFEDSVKIRLDSNTKSTSIGLSGGLDSSALALAMKNIKNDVDIISTENFGEDHKYLNYAIDKLDIKNNRQINVGYGEDNLKNIAKLSNTMRLPIPIYGESLGSYKLYNSIHNLHGPQIVLTGHGGDELFGCRDNFFINILHNFLKESGIIKGTKFLYYNFQKKHFNQTLKYFGGLINKNIIGHYRYYKEGKYLNLKERQLDELYFTNFKQAALISDYVSINNNVSLRMPFLDSRLRGLVNINFNEKIDVNFDRIILRNYLMSNLKEISKRKSKQGMRLLGSKIFKKNKDKIFDYLLNINHSFSNKSHIEKLYKKDTFNNSDSNYVIRLYSLCNIQ